MVAAMQGPGMTGQIASQVLRILVRILNMLRINGPRIWPQLYQAAVRAGVPQEVLPPPNASPSMIAQFAKKVLMFLRAYGLGSAQPQHQQSPMAYMQPGPVLGMAYGGPVLDVTTLQDKPVMAMAYGGRVDSIPALLRPGEYVATPEALSYDPTLASRISKANKATAGGMEGPVLVPSVNVQKQFNKKKTNKKLVHRAKRK